MERFVEFATAVLETLPESFGNENDDSFGGLIVQVFLKMLPKTADDRRNFLFLLQSDAENGFTPIESENPEDVSGFTPIESENPEDVSGSPDD